MIDVNYICEYCGKIVEPEETDVIGSNNVFGIATKVPEGWTAMSEPEFGPVIDFCCQEHMDIYWLKKRMEELLYDNN